VITIGEYAATFLVDERTARRSIREGQLRALQIGDTWRIVVAPLLRQCGLLDDATAEPGPGIDLENSEAGVGTPASASVRHLADQCSHHVIRSG
jgi:hypothetical protein